MKPVEKVLGGSRRVSSSRMAPGRRCARLTMTGSLATPSPTVTTVERSSSASPGAKRLRSLPSLGWRWETPSSAAMGTEKSFVLPPENDTLLEARTFPTPAPQREGGLVPCPRERCRMGS